MAKIENSDITQKAIKELRLNAALEKMPTDSSDKIVLTYPLNLKVCNIISNQAISNAVSGIIYTTPSDKDFYLVSCCLGVVTDNLSTSTESSIRVTIDGAVQRLLVIPTLTLTAERAELTLSLLYPVKIDRGTNITMNNSSAVANISNSASIIGYTEEK